MTTLCELSYYGLIIINSVHFKHLIKSKNEKQTRSGARWHTKDQPKEEEKHTSKMRVAKISVCLQPTFEFIFYIHYTPKRWKISIDLIDQVHPPRSVRKLN